MVGGACALVLLLFALSLLVPSAVAHAQATRPGLTGRESIDYVTGPVLGSGRIVGLGGAYTALALGSDGAAWTPAAYATRSLWALDWFQWDMTLDYSPAAFRDMVLDNSGRTGSRYNDFLFLTAGASVQAGAFGMGALVRMQDYRVGETGNLRLIIANYGAAYSLLDGQLQIGVAARTAALTITDGAGTSPVDFMGTGPEVGAALGLADKPYRVGVSARLAVRSDKANNVGVAAGLTLPRSLVLPAELQVGFAYQLGDRPLNRRFVNPHDVEKELRAKMLAARAQRLRDELARERQDERLRWSTATAPPGARMAAPTDESGEPGLSAEPRDRNFWLEELQARAQEERLLASALRAATRQREAEVKALPRRYLLLSAEAIFTGQTDNGIGLGAFVDQGSLLSQPVRTSGKNISLGLRLGAEGEPIQGRVKLRLGSYLEPSRFAGVPDRVHGTISTEVRLFAWNLLGLVDEFDLRIGASLDIAERYNNLGFGIGIWH